MLKMSDIFRIISFLEALSICNISNFMICYFVHQSAFMLRVLKHTCTCQDSSAYILLLNTRSALIFTIPYKQQNLPIGGKTI